MTGAEGELRAWLTERVAGLLDIPAREVDPAAPLRESGLSSRDAVSLAGELGERLGRPVPSTVVWQNPTILALATALSIGGEPASGGHDRPAEAAHGEPVAVIGLGVRLPGGVESPEDFWRMLHSGTDGIGAVPAGRWDDFAGAEDTADLPRLGGFLDDVAGFDAGFFGISPREAEAMDPQQRMLLEVTWSALEDAGIPPKDLRGSRTGVFVGLSSSEYGYLTMTDLPRIDAWSGTGAAASIVANRLSYLLDLRGPSLTIDTACSSSLVAVHQAVRSLQRGEISTAIVAGVNLLLSPAVTANFHRAGVLAADGKCKAFDASADGIVRGEGCGVVVLRRLSGARRGGDRVLSVLRGSAVNSDGRSNGMMAPNPEAQAMLLRDAYADADLDPAVVDYVEAHGTGTLLGDPIEAQALGAVLGAGRDRSRPLLIGSVKSNLGHLEGAAGIVGLIKVVLAMSHRTLPASLHYAEPNPHIDFADSALRVAAENVGWPRYSGIARAGVSAFGFGGTNAHLVLEEWPGLHRRRRARGDERTHVVAVSARTNSGLRRRAADLADWVDEEANSGESVGAVAATLAVRREHLPVRAAVVAGDRAELLSGLREMAAGRTNPRVRTGEARRGHQGVVFVFSGYGSQWAEMGRRLLATEPAFRGAVETLDRPFRTETGMSLRAVLAGEQEIPDLAAIQPVLFGVQVALAELWRAHGVEPAAVLGHSMGEVAAAVVAGALDVVDGLRVIATRATLLAGMDASGVGAMAVVELSETELEELAADYPGIGVAVYGSSSQCTVSGPADEVSALLEYVEGRGRFGKRLRIGGAGHSPAVDAILDEFRATVGGLRPADPRIPCYTSVLDDARAEPEFDIDYWAANLRRPVRFSQAVSAAIEDGHRTFVEISPHPITLAAIEQISAGKVTGIATANRHEDEPAAFLAGLADLHVAGAEGVLDRRYPDSVPIPLPAPPWEHRRYWPERRPTSSIAGGRHPLLGVHIELPEGGRHLWRGDVGIAAHRWLADHAAHGVPVFPGTGYLELALAAAAESLSHNDSVHLGSAVTITDLELAQVLPLSAHTEITTSVTWKDRTHGSFSVDVKSPTGRWTRHAAARISHNEADAADAAEPIGETTYDHPQARAVDLYPALDELGQAYGPAFRGLRAVTAASGRASARIELPAEAHTSPAYVVHPALADACLHTLAATAFDRLGTAEGAYLPLSLGTVRVIGDPSRGVRVDAVLDSLDADAEGLFGSVQLVDADGTILVDIRGVYARRMHRSSVPLPLSAMAFESRWESVELPAVNTATGSRTWLVLSAEDPGPASADGAGPLWLPSLRAHLAAHGDELVLAALADRAEWARHLRQGPAGVIVMTGAGPDPDPAVARRLILALSVVVAELAEFDDGVAVRPRLWTVTRGANAGFDGDAGKPDLAALRGLVRVLAFEHPDLRASTLDLDGIDEGVGALLWVAELVDEICADAADDEVLWREGHRFAARLAHAELEPGPADTPAVGPGAYVLSGGLGGLGLLAARWLAENGAARIVLSGRRGVTAESEQQVAELRELGTTIEIVAGDIAEPGVAEKLIEVATEDGTRLRGVLHAAGVLADGALATLDAADLETVWRAKVVGAQRLHEATAQLDLDWWLAYSSAAALFGSPGQGAYATANAWLDALVRLRHARGLPAATINWGAWADVGAATGKDNAVLEPLSPQEGVHALAAVLDSGRLATGVARLDVRTVLPLFPQLGTRPFFDLVTPAVPEGAESAGPAWQGMSELRDAEPAIARAALTDHLVGIVAGLMGFPAEEVNRHIPLTELGLDSLLAMRARGAVERDFGLALPVPMLLRGASLAEVAAHLAEEAGFGTGVEPAATSSAGPAQATVGPRDPAERWVARAWRDTLQRPGHGVDEDFFAVGGSTATAQRLYADIAIQLDEIPGYDTLFANPTMAAMADLLRERIDGVGGGPMRVLNPGDGERPLFLFHPAGGPTSVYRALVDQLGERRSCYGFERLDEVDTLEEKAARYLEMLRTVQPHGPYRLAGWSFGGCLAYETASLLVEAGEQVELVAMIDTILPLPAPGRTSRQLLIERFGRFAEHIERTYGVRFDVPEEKLRELDEHEQIRFVMDTLAENVSGMGEGVLHHQYTSYVDARVAERYRPRPYPGRVVLFRAKESHTTTTELDPRYLRTDETLGWDDYCANLDVVRVPGDHVSMIDPPNVDTIAAELRAMLATDPDPAD